MNSVGRSSHELRSAAELEQSCAENVGTQRVYNVPDSYLAEWNRREAYCEQARREWEEMPYPWHERLRDGFAELKRRVRWRGWRLRCWFKERLP